MAGRFLAADRGGAATADAMDPNSWNRYAYAGGDSINLRDPHGSFRCSDCDDDGDNEDEDAPPDPFPSPTRRRKQPLKPIPSDFPECNPGNNAVTEMKLNFLVNHYDEAASAAADVQMDMGKTIDEGALTVMFLQWGSWERLRPEFESEVAKQLFRGSAGVYWFYTLFDGSSTAHGTDDKRLFPH